jgi:hypothetical protein
MWTKKWVTYTAWIGSCETILSRSPTVQEAPVVLFSSSNVHTLHFVYGYFGGFSSYVESRDTKEAQGYASEDDRSIDRWLFLPRIDEQPWY